MLKKNMQKCINLSPQKNSATVWLLACANGKKNLLKLIQNLALTGTANTLMTYSECVSAAPSTENTPAPMDVDEDKASDDKKVTESYLVLEPRGLQTIVGFTVKSCLTWYQGLCLFLLYYSYST